MERRYYQRVDVLAESTFIIPKKEFGKSEFNGIIENVSESGICIRVHDPKYFSIIAEMEIGETIRFQAVGKYRLYDENRESVFSGEISIARVNDVDGDKIIGCKIIRHTPELDSYIDNMCLSQFMDRIFLHASSKDD